MPTKIHRIVEPTVLTRDANMKVRILYTGRYLDPDRLPLHRSKRREEGELVEFPGDYAEGIIASGLAEAFSGPDVMDGVSVEEVAAALATLSEGAVAEPEKAITKSIKAIINATPGAMALAKELGIDLADVRGTGAGGRIVMADLPDS